jgi:enamine deaminase RidA (YjgF/YER057c/UK114 family)
MRKSVRRNGKASELTIRRALEPAEYPFFDYRRFSFALGIAVERRVWLSGSTAVKHEAPSGMVVKGDLVAQASVIYDKMKATLNAANRSLSDVVRIVRYVTPKAIPDLAPLDALQAGLFGDNVSVCTLAIRNLLRPEALIEIEGVAFDGGDDGIDYLPSIVAPDKTSAWAQAETALTARGLSRAHVRKATALATSAVFDATEPAGALPGLRICVPRLATTETGVQIDIAVAPRASRVVYVSAEADPSIDGTVNQCRELYARLGSKLAAAGSSAASVVKTTEFIIPTGLRDYRGTADVRREVFAAPYPAATGVICERLSMPGAMIAVEAIALTEAG